MCKAFKCHICGLCWQAHAVLHNKPVANVLSHWVLYFSSQPSVALCSFASTGRNVPLHTPTCQLLEYFLQSCSLDRDQSTISAPAHLENEKFIVTTLLHAPRDSFPHPGLRRLCFMCRASSRAQAVICPAEKARPKRPLPWGVAVDSRTPGEGPTQLNSQ
jgi:hypothetical protein